MSPWPPAGHNPQREVFDVDREALEQSEREAAEAEAEQAMLDALDADEAPALPPLVEKAADRLQQAGILTERQALAYLLREVHGDSRRLAAARMDVSKSTLDEHLALGRQKVRGARETVAQLDDLDQ